MTTTLKEAALRLRRERFRAGPGLTSPAATASANRKLTELLGDTVVRDPPQDVVERLRATVAEHWTRGQTINGLSRRQLRRVPWILYLEFDGPKSFIQDTAFCLQYESWLAERGDLRAALAILKVLLSEWRTEPASFASLLAVSIKTISGSERVSATRWKERLAHFGGLNENTPSRLAGEWMERRSAPGFWMEREDAASGFIARSGFFQAVLEQCLERLREQAQREQSASKEQLDALIPALVDDAGNGLRFRSLLRPSLRALVEPWLDRRATREHQTLVAGLYRTVLGDPRLDDRAWHPDSAPLQLLKKWMLGLAFEDFFRIVRGTVKLPKQWESREKFWRAVLNTGEVTDAWVILGPEARRFAEKGQRKLTYGRLESADPSQSVLVMKLGSQTIGEWSHNGFCYLWDSKAKFPPVFDPKVGSYSTEKITRLPTAQYRHGPRWQESIANAIYKETGIGLEPKEYML